MALHKLETIIRRKKKRLGLGHGSGRGKTAGRGTKGQLARNSVPLAFEGGALPLVKRMPFLRGKDRNKVFRVKPFTVDVTALNSLPAKTTVDVATLVKHGLVEKEANVYGAKIIGNGTVNVAVTVAVPVTKGAEAQITKAGGSVAAK